MKNIIVFTFLNFVGLAPMFSQQEAANWMFGYPEYQHPQYGTALLHIDSLSKESKKYMFYQVPFESTSASISNNEGELLFYTNGCNVYNSQGQVIENGDQINPGYMHETMCADFGYPVPSGAAIVPYPKHPNQYILIHLAGEENNVQSIKYGPLYYSVVQYDTLGGEQKLISINNVLLNGNIEGFDICRHGNGRDWWLVTTVFPSDKYYKFIISADGVKLNGIDSTGGIFPEKYKKGIGAIRFSNKGDKIARWNASYGLKLLNFDRCSGKIESLKNFNLKDGNYGGGGVCFTKNDNYLYVNSQLVIYRIDLNNITSTNTLDSLLYATNNWGVSLERSELAADGNIYFSQMASTTLMPFLTNVENTDKAKILLDYKSLNLVSLNARTLPHFPNFRLGKLQNSECDTLTQTLSVSDQSCLIYPNPAKNTINLEFKDKTSINSSCSIKIFNCFGQKLIETSEVENFNKINLTSLPTGKYFIKLYYGNNVLYSNSFIKME